MAFNIDEIIESIVIFNVVVFFFAKIRENSIRSFCVYDSTFIGPYGQFGSFFRNLENTGYKSILVVHQSNLYIMSFLLCGTIKYLAVAYVDMCIYRNK